MHEGFTEHTELTEPSERPEEGYMKIKKNSAPLQNIGEQTKLFRELGQ